MKIKLLHLVVAGTVLFSIAGFSTRSLASRGFPVSIDIHVQIPTPTRVILHNPPALAVIPGTNVYVAPDVEAGIVFYQGVWWRPYEGHWYRSHSYNGPWRYIAPAGVPRVIFGLPRGFQHSYRHHRRYHYQEVERNWRRWEREHHWEKAYRHERENYRDRDEHRKFNEPRDYNKHQGHDNRYNGNHKGHGRWN